MGRRTKLNQDIQEGICKAIRGGLTYEQAATFNGITATTFYAWKARGEKQKTGQYANFLEAVKRANVEARAIHLQRIARASQGGAEVEEVSVSEKTELDPATNQHVIVSRETRKTTKKALPQWQASAWILERRFPSEYGKLITPQLPDDKDPLDDWIDGLSEAREQFGEDG